MTRWRRWRPTTRGPMPACRRSPRPTPSRRAGRPTASAPFKSATKWSGSSYGEHGNWVIGAPDVLLDPGSPAADDGRADRREGAARAVARLIGPLGGRSRRARHRSTPVALVVLEQRVRPDARDTWNTLPSRRSRSRSSPATTRSSVGAVAESLGLARRDDGRAQAARATRRRSPTPCRSTRPSAGYGPTRSGPWCTPCSRAATPSR